MHPKTTKITIIDGPGGILYRFKNIAFPPMMPVSGRAMLKG
jgi:hypothetical protein